MPDEKNKQIWPLAAPEPVPPKQTHPDDEKTVEIPPGWEAAIPHFGRASEFETTEPMTYEQAIEYARKTWGADPLGRIQIVRKVDPDREVLGGPPKPSALQAALDVLGAHRNWREDDNTHESLKVWTETVNDLEKALRNEGYGEEIDRLYKELDEENEKWRRRFDAQEEEKP